MGAGEQFVINIVTTGAPQAEAAAGKVSGAMRGMEAAATKASTAGGRSATSMSQKWTAAGTTMAATGKKLNRNVSLPILAIGAVTGKMAIDFEKGMRNVNSIAQLPEPAFKRLNRSVLEMAGPTAQAPKTLAEGLYDLVSSGFDANESIVVLNASARAATAGLTTTEVSTKAVAAALNAYHRPASDAKQISDDLFQTVNLGVVTFDELASTIGYVLPAAATMGIDLKQVGASISTLTKQGQSGSNAVTNINAAITAFIKPSKAMKSLLKELGYETSAQLIHQKGFQGALELVTRAVGGNKEAIGELFPNVRAMRAVFGLTGDGAKSAGKDLLGFANDTGATATVLKEQSKSLAFQWNQLKAEGSVLAIELGNKLIPVFRSVAHDLGSIVHGFTTLPEPVQSATVKLLIFGALLGPIVRIAGAVATAIGGIGTAITFLAGTDLAAAISLALGGELGGFTMLGSSLAGKIVGGLAKGLPIAAATFAVGNTLTSVLSGDFKDAGFELGGSLIGGVLGFMVGGPAGAAIGAGLGNVGGELIAGLFDDGKATKTLHEKLKETVQSASVGRKAFASSTNLVENAEARLERTGKRQSRITDEIRAAQKRLNNARQAGDLPRIRREEAHLNELKAKQIHLTHQQWNQESLLHAAKVKNTQDARRTRTVEVALVRTREAAVEQAKRHEQFARKAFEQAVLQQKPLKEQNEKEKELIESQKRRKGASEKLKGAEKELGGSMKEITQKFGKDFADQLRKQIPLWGSTAGQWRKGADALHQLTPGVKTLNQIIGGYKQRQEASAEASGKGTRSLKRFGAAAEEAGGKVKTARTEVVSGFTGMEAKSSAFLGALDVPSPFQAPAKASGGLMEVRGQGNRDTVPLTQKQVSAMVAPGELLAVINRHQAPLLSRALHNEYGVDGLSDFFSTYDKPHHMAIGGLVEPKVRSGGAFRAGEQRDLHIGFQAAVKYLQTHDRYGRLIRNGDRMDALQRPYLWGGGHGATASVSGPWDCSGGISELLDGAGFKTTPMVSGGFTSYGLAGKGKASILANAEHVYAVLGNRAIGTSSENPGGGFGWIDGYTYRPGFTVRHVDLGEGSSARGAARGGKGQPPKKGFATGGFVSTAYGPPWTGINGTGVTATEVDLRDSPHRYIVAVDPDVVPLHSQWVIRPNPFHTDKAFAAEDTGSAIQGKRIDFYDWRGRQSQLGWGRKTVTLYKPGEKGAGGEAAPIHKKAEYGFTGGATSAGGTYAPGRGSVSTDRLPSFGSLPDTLFKCRKELGERRAELAQYRRAYKIQKDPRERAALKVNIDLLTNRIQALLRQQARLVRERHEKRVEAKLKKRGLFPALDALLGGDEFGYERSTEYAGQVIDLEPEKLTDAYAGSERGAFGSELARELKWRNDLLLADKQADKRTRKITQDIADIEALKGKDQQAYNRQKFRLKPLREALGDVATQKGEWATKLGEVQGLTGPRGILSVLPAEPQAGSFGGFIFETQKSIRDLDLRLKSAHEEGGGESELDAAKLEQLEEENRILRRERAVEQAQRPVLADYLGAYKTGGVLPADGYYMGHKGETVIPSDIGALMHLAVNINGRDGILEQLIEVAVEKRLTAAGRRVGLGRSTPSAPGRRAAMTQGRSR